ncbi:DNA-binding transcriptional LysR family regulator [Rubricella aquisinus]|uniref:DNA-binding transcriptional LysR family regulator n=1 Tax=Rubricella aquisinus TaxID=2028108 RepID=A0A840WMH3_9RHOB|nr:LysR family transcriptional regulator [Rubricella aquisinus]MBB5516259.1 DNA-binding transcriptional LysR family regulator [Rubricella aquisinus]
MTRLNLEQLRSFLWVVRMGGVRKAADGLNVTQPAITARIKALETTLGAEVFDRTTTGLKLTKRGELLLRYAEQFEQLSALVERNVIDPDGIEGHLRVGASETIAQIWLPDFITRLHQRFPKIEIEVNVDISIVLRAALFDREVDLALLLGPISDYSVDNVELPGFELAWYAAATMPEPDHVDGYFNRPVITYARNTRPFREVQSALFERVGPDVRLFPSSSLSACIRLVEAGLGVAALPVVLGESLTALGTVKPFDPGWVPEPLRFSASYLADPKSQIVEIAAKCAAEVAEEYLGYKNI